MQVLPYETEEDFKPKEKQINILNILFYLGIFSFLIFTAVLSGYIFQRSRSGVELAPMYGDIVLKVVENLQYPQIIDFYAQRYVESSIHALGLKKQHLEETETEEVLPCRAGYEATQLGSFKGVKEGCLCPDGSFTEDECHKSQERKGCKDVPLVPKEVFKHWNEFYICAQKVSAKWIGSKTQCPKNYKLCQPGLCVDTTNQCPINKVQLSTTEELRDPQVRKLQLQQTYTIKSEGNESPFTNFRMTPGISTNGPCYEQLREQKFESGLFYPLKFSVEKGCNQQRNLNFMQLESQEAHTVLKQNKFQKILKKLPFWKNYQKNTDRYNLQLVRRIEIKTVPACDYVTPENILQLKNTSQIFPWAMKFAAFPILIISCVSILIGIILFILKDQNIGSLFMNAINQTKILFFLALICGISLFYMCHSFNVMIDGKNGLKQLHQNFQAQQTIGCFPDERYQDMLQTLHVFVYNSYEDKVNLFKIGETFSLVFLFFAFLFPLAQMCVCKQKTFENPWG